MSLTFICHWTICINSLQAYTFYRLAYGSVQYQIPNPGLWVRDKPSTPRGLFSLGFKFKFSIPRDSSPQVFISPAVQISMGSNAQGFKSPRVHIYPGGPTFWWVQPPRVSAPTLSRTFHNVNFRPNFNTHRRTKETWQYLKK